MTQSTTNQEENVKLVSNCKTKIEQLGEVTVPLVFKDKGYKVQFYVVDHKDLTPLLSLKTFAEQKELVKRVDEMSSKSLITVPEVQTLSMMLVLLQRKKCLSSTLRARIIRKSIFLF